MKWQVLLLVALVATFALGQRPFVVDDLHAVQRMSGFSVSPDGKKAAYAVRGWNAQTKKTTVHLELVDVATGSVSQLTSPAEGQSDSEPIWSPNSDIVVFISNRKELSQLWYVPVTNPVPVQLTQYPNDDISNLKWSKDGSFIAFSSSVYIDCPAATAFQCTADRDAAQAALGPNTGFVYESLYVRHWATWETPGKHSHIFVQGVKISGVTVTVTSAPRDVMYSMNAASPVPPFGGGEQFAISSDSSEIAFTAEIIKHDTAWTTGWRVYTVPVAGGTPNWISQFVPEDVRTSNPVYQPNGPLLAYLAFDRPGLESDRFHINLYDREHQTTRPLTSAWDRSVSELSWTSDGRSLFATATDQGVDKLYLVDQDSGNVHELIGTSSNTGTTANGNQVVLSRNSLTAPADLWVATVDYNSKTVQGIRQLTKINDKFLSQFQMSQPTKYFFVGGYGNTVQGWVMKPYAFDATKKYPVVFLIHGGPEGSWEDSWSYRWNPQLWVQRGYAVVMVNPHGSTGMGQNFTDAVRNDWGGVPFTDLMTGLDVAIQNNPWMDGNRTCACGASYGGYMINWIQGQTNRFKCLVNHDGVMDTRAMHLETEELWFPESEYCPINQRGCTPWTRPEGYEKFNPRNYVQNWQTPMLVIHGGHDYRIPESQGLSAFTALQRRGIPSKLLYFPMESHWVLKPDNGIMWYNNVLGWIDQWIGKH